MVLLRLVLLGRHRGGLPVLLLQGVAATSPAILLDLDVGQEIYLLDDGQALISYRPAEWSEGDLSLGSAAPPSPHLASVLAEFNIFTI